MFFAVSQEEARKRLLQCASCPRVSRFSVGRLSTCIEHAFDVLLRSSFLMFFFSGLQHQGDVVRAPR